MPGLYCFLIAILCCDSTFAVEKRIINGVAATTGKFPYMASLRDSTNTHYCGGSIINQNYVLTAARCLGVTPNFKVVVGTDDSTIGGTPYVVASFLQHPSYAIDLFSYDVGIIKTSTPIVYSATVAPVVLSSIDLSVGTVAVVSGWGSTSYPVINISKLLQALNTTVLSQSSCQSYYTTVPFTLKSTQMCAFKNTAGFCVADMGGPLVYGGLQFGIASMAVFCAKNYPDIYTKTSSVYIWILTNAV